MSPMNSRTSAYPSRTVEVPSLGRAFAFFAAAAFIALGLSPRPALAQVQNLCLLELDAGDTSTQELCTADQGVSAPAGSNQDWNILIAGGTANPSSGTGTLGQFSGVAVTVGDQFTTGTKVLDPVSTWTYKIAAGGPAKADLQQGMTATYTYTQSPPAFSGGPATFDDIIYYAVTRATNNGSELQGTWFFVNPVAPKPIVAPAKTAGFSGFHSQGDLYLLSAFSQGGGTVGIQVYEWNCTGTGSTCDSTGSLTPKASGACTGSSANNFECGVVNTSSITVPTALSNPNTGTTLAAGLFYEGGVDISNVFGSNVPCFSSVMFESVSSPSCSTFPCSSLGNAAAKFFISSPFNTCKANVTKTCGIGTLNFSTGDITYPISGIVSNADGGTLTLSSITDSAPGTIAADSPSGLDAGSLKCSTASGCTDTDAHCASCSSGLSSTCSGLTLTASSKVCYQATFTAAGDQCGNGCKDTVTATVSGPTGSNVPAATQSATCSFQAVGAGLEVFKTCSATLVSTASALQVQVNTQFLVCNDQPAPLSNVTLTDRLTAGPQDACPSGYTLDSNTNPHSCTKAITLSSTSLAPEGEANHCISATSSYVPVALPSDVNTNCPNGTFQDTATATGDCDGSLCNTGAGQSCTLNGTTLTCSANSNTATCPLCPLGQRTPTPPVDEAEPTPTPTRTP